MMTALTTMAERVCPECGYNLRGLTSQRCPECGWEIDARTMDILARVLPVAGRRGRRLAVVATALVLAALIGIAAWRLMRVTSFSWKDPFDAMAVVGASIAIAGMLALAVLGIRAHRASDADRARIGRALGLTALASIGVGVVAAMGAAIVPVAASAPGRGSPPKPVASGLEVGTHALLFALPGAALFVLSWGLFESVPSRRERAEAIVRAREEADAEGSAPFVVQCFGRYTESQVTHVRAATPRRTTPEVEAIIDRTWNEKLAEAQQKGVLLYNGELSRLIRCGDVGGRLTVETGPGYYRDFVGTNLHNARAVLEFGEDYLANPCGVSSNVLTADGCIVVGRRNHRVAYHPGFQHPFGGAVEADDREGGCNIFHAARRELIEELRITPAEIREIVCIGLVRDRFILQPEFIFDAALTLTLADLLARFAPGAPGQEHDGLESCYDIPEEVQPFIERSRPIAPIGEAALLLHGRRVWGEEWYDTTCLLLYNEFPSELRRK